MQCQQIFTHSPLQNFSYLVYAKDGSRVFCIDPWDGDDIIAILKQYKLKLSHIINTHEHFDHTRGNQTLVDYYKEARVWAHEKAAGRIANLDRGLRTGERIGITDGCYFEVMDTPGHTFAHVSLLLCKKKQAYGVFSGDTFFNAGVGHCRNGGDPHTLYTSISGQYAKLADHVYVYPGHDYMGNNLDFTLHYEKNNRQALAEKKKIETSSQAGYYPHLSNMGLERQINLFLRLDELELRQELQTYFPEINASSSEKDVFLRLRQLRDRW